MNEQAIGVLGRALVAISLLVIILYLERRVGAINKSIDTTEATVAKEYNINSLIALY